MNEPKYVFDTNVFINLKNKYPSDISMFRPLWSKIEKLFEDKIIISSDEVIEEIEKGHDELKDWAKVRKDSFYKGDEVIQQIVREILKNFQGLVTSSKKANGADPFVIALAKQFNCALVTEENRSGDDLHPKIPNVCTHYGIRHIRIVDFFRENNF